MIGKSREWLIFLVLSIGSQDYKLVKIHCGGKGSIRLSYRVDATYHLMNQSNIQIHNWPWEQTWKAKIPYKVSCFVWLLAREVVLTLENFIYGFRFGYKI